MRVKSKIVSGLLAFMMLFGSAQNSSSWNSAWLELMGVSFIDLLLYKNESPVVGIILFNLLFGSDIAFRFMNKNVDQENKNKEEIKKYKEKIEYYKNLYGSLDQYDENGKKIS